MIKKNYAIELPELDDFEYTGEFRRAKTGEFYLLNNYPMEALPATLNYHPILKKVAPKYKTTEIHTDNGMIKYIEIQAIKHAVDLLENRQNVFHWGDAEKEIYKALKALIK